MLTQRPRPRLPHSYNISIIGFDDIRFAQFSTPSLTTIRQPVEDIGSNCMNMLIDLMTGERTKSDYIELVIKD